jgi:hypothetical protein
VSWSSGCPGRTRPTCSRPTSTSTGSAPKPSNYAPAATNWPSYSARAAIRREGREQTRKLADRLREIEATTERASGDDPVAALVGSEDVHKAWQGLNLAAKRSVMDTLARITILPAGKGIRWKPDQVRIDWRVS